MPLKREAATRTIWPVVTASITVVEPSASAENVPLSLEKAQDATPEWPEKQAVRNTARCCASSMNTLSDIDHTTVDAECERERRGAPYAGMQHTSKLLLAGAAAAAASVHAGVKKQDGGLQLGVVKRL